MLDVEKGGGGGGQYLHDRRGSVAQKLLPKSVITVLCSKGETVNTLGQPLGHVATEQMPGYFFFYLFIS